MKIKAIALILALPLTAIAKNIGLTEAQSIAAKFFNDSGISTVSPNISQKASVSPLCASSPAYYVFNAGSPEGGFVIIAADDRLGRVLGYSDKGEFSLDGAPESLIGLMAMYEAYAANLAAADAPSGRSSAETVGQPVVNPLLNDIKWGQDAPFNTLCPTYSSTSGLTHYYVGCVATAATQIMRYHGYPSKGIGEKSYTFGGMTLSADFGNTVYDWANMPASVPEMPTGAQTDAYSTLAYHFGVAVEMQYEQGGSGAFDHMVAPALRKYFGYDSGARMYLREHFSTAEWLGMIKGELDAKRPVFYGATSDNGSGGHAFVLDGYDSNDYFHVNWGWYGRSNGYFMINHLNPDELGEGGGYGGYNIQQDMVIGIQPPSEASEAQPAIYGATRLRASYFGASFLIMTGLENLDTDAFSGTVAAVITDMDGNIIKNLYSDPVKVEGFANGRTGALPTYTMRSVPVDVTGLEDGNYRLRLAYHADGDTEWHFLRHPVGTCQYMNLRIKSGMIMEATDHLPSPDVELQSKLDAYSDLYAGCPTRIGFDIYNRSEDYRLSKITVRLTSEADPDEYVELAGSEDVYEASEKQFELSVTLPDDITPGAYTLTAYDPAFPDNVFDDALVGTARVTVYPTPDSPVIRVRSAVISNTEAPQQGVISALGVTLRNDGVDGTANVLLRLKNKIDGKSMVFLEQPVEMKAGQNSVTTFARYMPHDEGVYEAELCQVNADGTEHPLDNYLGEISEVKVVSNAALDGEVIYFDFPEKMISGHRYPYTLMVKGNKTGSATICVRLRLFTNKSGEMVTMSTKSLTTGGEVELSGNYRCALADGRYMAIVDNRSLPYAGHNVYYREVTVGETVGIDDVIARPSGVAVAVDGDVLLILPANGTLTERVEIYNMAGLRVLAADGAVDALPVGSLQAGAYIVKVMCSDSTVETAKFILED